MDRSRQSIEEESVGPAANDAAQALIAIRNVDESIHVVQNEEENDKAIEVPIIDLVSKTSDLTGPNESAVNIAFSGKKQGQRAENIIIDSITYELLILSAKENYNTKDSTKNHGCHFPLKRVIVSDTDNIFCKYCPT